MGYSTTVSAADFDSVYERSIRFVPAKKGEKMQLLHGDCLELMKDDYETAKVMLNNMWRAKQRVTMQVIRRILSERKPTTN